MTGARQQHREPPRPPAAPSKPAERAYVIQVALTAREINALVGQKDTAELPVAFCVTSADNLNNRVNLAELALRKFRAAALQQRP
jgi:hypothetical protein